MEGIDKELDTDTIKNGDNEIATEVQKACRIWALIHFYALRPPFNISLLLWLTSHTSGHGALTFHSGIVQPIHNLMSLVQMESKSYSECVQQSTNRTYTIIVKSD